MNSPNLKKNCFKITLKIHLDVGCQRWTSLYSNRMTIMIMWFLCRWPYSIITFGDTSCIWCDHTSYTVCNPRHRRDAIHWRHDDRQMYASMWANIPKGTPLIKALIQTQQMAHVRPLAASSPQSPGTVRIDVTTPEPQPIAFPGASTNRAPVLVARWPTTHWKLASDLEYIQVFYTFHLTFLLFRKVKHR